MNKTESTTKKTMQHTERVRDEIPNANATNINFRLKFYFFASLLFHSILSHFGKIIIQQINLRLNMVVGVNIK